MGKGDRINKVLYFTDISHLSEALTHFNLDGFHHKKIPIKLHMGEKNNHYFPRPNEVKYAVDALKKYNARPFLFDTTVAYSGRRHNKTTYHKLADLHGFSTDQIGCTTIIDDTGVNIEIDNRKYTVADHIIHATHMFAWSHVTGHVATGMGGAIKNYGMGGVTKETKRRMHQGSRPVFHADKCTHCGICAEDCPFNALEVTSDTWTQNHDSCFGCGGFGAEHQQ